MSNKNIETIRKNINKAIFESKMSRLKITELANISYPNLARFLNDKKTSGLSLDVLNKLADVLRVPVSYFLGNTDKAGNPVMNVGNEQLPEEWDIIIKRVMSMPEKDRDKAFSILKATVDALIK